MLKAVFIAAVSGLIWTAYFNFMRWFRQRSPQARERMAFKRRLPGWLKTAENLLLMVFFLGIFLLLLRSALALHGMVRPEPEGTFSPAGGILAFSSLLAALAPSMLAANLVSWLVPAMRRANLAAMKGLPAASFRELNLGLIKFAGIVTPLCAAAALVGIFGPWP